jgi:DNA-binding MarR family transcriptional regulator
MTDSTKTPSTLQRVLTALAELGPVTATKVGESIGIAYPTTTSKLRELESTGHAERVRIDQRTTLWQLTDAGKAAAASLTTGTTSVEGPPDPSAPDDDAASAESGQQANPHPEAEPQPGAEPLSQEPGEPPVGTSEPQTDSAAEIGRVVPAPTLPTGTAATDACGPEAEQEADPDPQSDAAESVGTVQDPPTGEPPAGEHTGETRPDSAVGAEQQTPAPDEGTEASTKEGDGRRRPAQPRRRKGELRDEVLALLRRNPDTAYKVGEICRLINQAHDGTAVNRASAGAVANALDKLVIAGTVTRLDTKVATYQAA